jgi:integrase
MARRPSVRYWSSRNAYMCWHNGRQAKLAEGPDDAPTGPTFLAALAKFRELLELDQVDRADDRNTIRAILETYLRHIAAKKKQSTVEIRLRAFRPFVDYRPEDGPAYGERRVADLTHFDLYRFMEAMEVPRHAKRKKEQKGRKPVGWGPGSQRNFLQGLNAAFNWAVRSGLLPKNPVTGIEKPGAASRGAESLIGATPAEVEQNHRRILAAAPPMFRPFLQALKDTGARPGEIAAATAADFKPDLGAFVFNKEMTRRGERFSHKTARKNDRVIFLSRPTLEYVREMVGKYPTGPLFRRKVGRGFHKVYVVGAFLKLQKKLGMPMLTAYSYRHTYATELLKAGMDVDTLAELMGNSAMIIRQHYSHLLAGKKGLRSKLEHFRKAAEETSTRQDQSSVAGSAP